MKIACILTSGFEDAEFRVPYERFRQAGHNVIIVSAKAGELLEGGRGKVEVHSGLSIEEVQPEEFDALFIPGGYSPDKLRADERFVRFVRGFASKPIFAICHGPQLLITAGMVNGRTMTAWKTVQVDLKNSGADVVDRDVVVDGNLVTSRQPSDLDAFAREALQLLEAGTAAHPH